MKLLVIDGNSIANRSYYGIRLLSNKKGVFTNAVTGFLNTYLKLIKLFSPDCCVVAFDMHKPTFRTQKFAEYKANRKGMPDELRMQMPYIKNILKTLGVKILECEGFEADDILGTLAYAADKSGNYCILASGDRDCFQLVTDRVSLNLAKTNDETIFTPALIKEVYELTPRQMIDVKALMGDSGDNIPGVKGIGEKTALSLIQKYGSIENIYLDLDKLDVSAAVRKKLEDGREMCFLSYELGVISTSAPVSVTISDYVWGERDEEKLAEILTELEMQAMLKKLNVNPALVNKAIEKQQSESKINEDEKLSLYTFDKDMVCLFLSDGKFICYNNQNNCITEIIKENQIEFLKSDVKKCFFNIKEVWNYIFNNFNKNAKIKNAVFDTTLAAYLLNVNSSEYTLERLCLEYGVEYFPFPETLNDENQNNFGKCIYALNSVLYEKICKENLNGILNDIELPLAEVLASMETDGIELDIAGIKSFGAELENEIKVLENKIFELAGVKFNISSPKQLGEILFEKLMLPSGKKMKTGYSTNADVLEFLMDKHAIIPLISEYRSIAKLNSTYVLGLLKTVSEDGRIHTTFKQTETRTGRISSVEPNIQNIPVRTARGRKMRGFFSAKEKHLLIDADYSQIELRVLAHISGDKIMQNAFINGDDIHTITASQVFNQPPEWVTPEMRSSAKAVNFGIVYGIGAFSLSKDIGVSVSEADRYIKNYLSKYHDIKDYMDNTVTSVKKLGYVQTILGRRRYIPEINSSNKNIEALGKRMAMNTPIQGTAADIIKLAMVRVYNKLKESNLPARLILQVHDELIVEAEENVVDEVEKLLKAEMEAAVKLVIPLTADIKSGKTWYEAH